jgi:hydrophobe/amphiphile efflux-1 (HAE1) family protein
MTEPPPPEPPPDREYLFIRRPVTAGVISIVITLLGLLAVFRLPIARYPQITPPSVQVIATYPGATAEDVAQAVAAPIEQQLSGLNGLLYYQSANSSDGVMTLTVVFDISRDQDLAAVDVQNAEKLAEPQLPEEVRRNGIVIQKAQTDILAVGSLTSDDPRYDAAFLNNYAKIYVEDELKRVPGVGNAIVFGNREFAMLVSLDPDKMAQLGITVDDVANAIREQNATNPAGRLGRAPSPNTTELTFAVTTRGRLASPRQFDSVVVRARSDGSLVRVSDVGTVRLGSRSYETAGRLDGKPTANFLIFQRPGANALDVVKGVQKRMAEISRSFPAGVRWALPFDTTPFIRESIKEVVTTLLEAMALVTLVVFVFLQSLRATIIPLLAVPVSIIGSFLGVQALGMSINTLTLFGLVLAIGIVVDDAIVVIENAERIMAEEHLPARQAADKAIKQVSGALVAIVLVLCAVFVPVAFIGGITGTFYQQFAATIAISVVLSGIVALTLTPALCALLLQKAPEESENRLARAFNRRFQRFTELYQRQVGRVTAHPWRWLAAFVLLIAVTVIVARRVPSSFLPTEDKGFFVVGMQLPDAASLARTEAMVAKVEAILRRERAVSGMTGMVGLDILTRANQTNSAVMFVRLKPWSQRNKNESVDALLQRVNGALFGLKEGLAFGFNFPEVPGLGTSAGLEMQLQAKTGIDIRQFAQQVQAFVADANRLPELQGVNAFVRADVPQVYVDVDRDAAAAHGVGVGAIASTLQAMLSTLYVNDFNLYGRTWRVQAEAQAPFRQRPEDIGRLFVRNRTGEMVPVGALVRTEMRTGPTMVTRFNGFLSALVTGTPRPGKSSGEMLAAVERLVDEKYAARGIGAGFSGQSYQERASAGQSGLVLILGLVLVFLVLAALYESWSIPFAVLLGVPFGVAGAYFGVWIRGIPSDVYFTVGLITVVGLAVKNAILIVAFAAELHRKGRPAREAAIQAARERFRPILMTSLAFIFGISPLLIAGGAGAASRHSLGTGVFAGMLFATAVGILFIPLFFTVIRRVTDRTKAPRAEPAELQS